jgi:hypothetical protein
VQLSNVGSIKRGSARFEDHIDAAESPRAGRRSRIFGSITADTEHQRESTSCTWPLVTRARSAPWSPRPLGRRESPSPQKGDLPHALVHPDDDDPTAMNVLCAPLALIVTDASAVPLSIMSQAQT